MLPHWEAVFQLGFNPLDTTENSNNSVLKNIEVWRLTFQGCRQVHDINRDPVLWPLCFTAPSTWLTFIFTIASEMEYDHCSPQQYMFQAGRRKKQKRAEEFSWNFYPVTSVHTAWRGQEIQVLKPNCWVKILPSENKKRNPYISAGVRNKWDNMLREVPAHNRCSSGVSRDYVSLNELRHKGGWECRS